MQSALCMGWAVRQCLPVVFSAVLVLLSGGIPEAHAAPSTLASGFHALQTGARIVLMPADIELFSLSAGGVREPRADWTADALEHFSAALASRNADRGLATLALPLEQAGDYDEIANVHALAARAITRHHFGEETLPAKQGQLDWTLGEAVQAIREGTGADYALYVHMRDSYASPERIAMLPVSLLLGGLPYVGTQRGHASLVDLRSGRIVWFNRLQRQRGNLRDAEGAGETVQALLRDFPYPALAPGRSASDNEVPPPPVRATRRGEGGASPAAPESSSSLSSPEAGLRFMLDRDEARLKRSPFAITDEKLLAYMQGIACRLAPDLCRDIRVHLVRGPFFHASMQANGALQVWSGLMLRMENEAQMAAVLAHEIAHYLQRHTLRKADELKSGAALVEAFGIFARIGGAGERRLREHMAAFTRDQEREADRMSVAIMSRAGYDAREAAKIWRPRQGDIVAHGVAQVRQGAAPFATHPRIEEREASLARLAQELDVGVVNAGEWQAAIEAHAASWRSDEAARQGSLDIAGQAR
jgi:hypothetical protein